MFESKDNYIKIKDVLDRILAIIGMIILSPVFFGIIIAIKLEDGFTAPVFFIQKRVGIHKTHFQLYKFRSMRLDAPHDMPTHLLDSPEQYITRTGKFLRRTSLDELPQMWNIARGDMVIIGPRPALWNQFDLIKERDKYGANDVKPGLTGWAQINGRDELEIEEKAKLDGYYVKHMGLLMDIRCFIGTIFSVLKSEGIVEGGTGTMGKKKIVVLSNHDVLTYKFRKEVLQAMLAAGYRVILVLPYGEKVEEMKKWGCEFIDNPEFSRHGTNILGELKLLLAYRRIFKVVKPDLVLAYTIKPNLYGGIITSAMRIPFVASITGLGTAVENKGLVQQLVKIMYRACLRKSACIFAQNQKIKQFLTDRGISSRIVVVPGSGVNLEEHYFEEYPANDEEIILITIGRLMKDKGTEELLRAARQIRNEYPNVRFQMIGFDDGNYKEIVEKAVKENVVEYPGFQDNVHEWIKHSHAIVHPSYHEGMANVLLESASTGRPVIASDIPGCQETFEQGVSGIGFRPQSTKDLVRAIREFVELPYEKKAAMGLAGRQKMEKEFDRNYIIKIYLDEIKNIIG